MNVLKDAHSRVLRWAHRAVALTVGVALLLISDQGAAAAYQFLPGADGRTVSQKSDALTGGPVKAEAETQNPAASPLNDLITTAAKAQAAGDLVQAASLWQNVLSQDVDAVVRNKAHFNAGVCYSHLKDYRRAIDHFEEGLKSVPAESVAEVPQALLYLGHGQLELGREIQAAVANQTDDQLAQQDRDTAMQLLTTSSTTLGSLLRRHPDFGGNDRAALFQGNAFEQLGRLDEAVAAYEKALTYEQSTVAIDAGLALAILSEKLGRYTDAAKHLDAVIQAASNDPDRQPVVVESKFRAAEVLMKLGEAQKQAGSDDLAARDFKDAFAYYQAVASDRENGRLVPLAMYGAAWSQMNLGTIGQNTDATADADRWFSRLITAYPEHPLATDAKVGRASARRLLGDVENASKDLIDVASDPEANRTQAGDDASEPVQRLETAWFELGLLHAKGKSWNDAEKVFAQLIAEYPQSPNLDRYRYELAWAYQSQTPAKSAAALEQFATIVDQTPDSEFVAEAHFHLADAAKAREDFETAARLYRVVVESNLPAAVRERSRYNLAWLDFQAERFDAAAKQFEDQLAEFPKGRLATDAKFMFAESQFRQQNHRDALQAYLVAKPAIEMASQVDQKMRTLTALHGAASANEAGEFEQAIRLARPITDDEFDPAYRADAWLQLGVAQAGSGDQISAIESWHNATPSLSVTGAQARCLIGRALTDAGRTREALNEFRKVFLGFGGSQAEDEVRPWQAFALYESARLNQSLCRDARGDQLQRLVTAATEQYQQLVDHYGDSDLAEEATKQLEKLSKF